MAKKRPTPAFKDHKKQGQLPIRTNAIYVGEKSLNIYLTYDQAVQAATNILKKAELLKDHDNYVIQLWTMKGSTKLNFGITDAKKAGAQGPWE